MTLPQRPLRGSRISSFYPVKSLPSLSSLDSAFQLQEYISLLIRLDVHDVESIVSLPGKRKDGGEDAAGKNGEESDADKAGNEIMVDEPCWIYEQLRRLAQDLTHPLINMLQQECTRSTCPEMKAGEWLYLCVAHGNEGALEQCCAIDYILHTLDSATALLNTPRAFPSRLQIPTSSHRHFGSLARRLGRIFAHAYFHHREAFEQAEAESSLYARFCALTEKYELVPKEFMVIPPRPNHGAHGEEEDDGDRRGMVKPMGVNPSGVESHPTESGSAREAKEGPWLGFLSPPTSTGVSERGTSPINASPGSDSPRKMGRGRTDTMVLNEAYAIAEELSKANGEGKKEVEKDLNSFSLLAKPEQEGQSEPDVASAKEEEEEAQHADVPIIPDQDQQSSPTSSDHPDPIPIPDVTPSSSTALPEADVTEVTAVNATPEISPEPHALEFDEKDVEPVAAAVAVVESKEEEEKEEPPAAVVEAEVAAEEEEEPKPAVEDTPPKDADEGRDITPSSSTTLQAEPPSAAAANAEDSITASATLITDISGLANSEPEPTVSAGDEVPDSPVVPREDREDVEVPSEASPPPPAATAQETKEEEEEPVAPVVVPETAEEKVESEMKELVGAKEEEESKKEEEKPAAAESPDSDQEKVENPKEEKEETPAVAA